MSPLIDIDNASSNDDTPEPDSIRRWVTAALQDRTSSELSIRIVDRDEIQQLNDRYRHKNYPTNVLSFPAELPDDIPVPLLGDIIICADVVAEEAAQQHKPLTDHWAHMVIHGTLHLLGYDHIESQDAEIMEALEIKLLATLNIANPYEIDEQETGA